VADDRLFPIGDRSQPWIQRRDDCLTAIFAHLVGGKSIPERHRDKHDEAEPRTETQSAKDFNQHVRGVFEEFGKQHRGITKAGEASRADQRHQAASRGDTALVPLRDVELLAQFLGSLRVIVAQLVF